MTNRIKYPLTLEAKEEARHLLQAWDKDEIQQAFYLIDVTGGSGVEGIRLNPGLGARSSFIPPALGIIRELGEYKLISLARVVTAQKERFEVTLLQELRNAVQNDFDVSDFFLTTSAIGTIVYGNLTLDRGALFQSAAAGIGDVNVTAQTLPDELVKLLGADALRPEIAAAISALKVADEPTRLEKAGKVIEELGRGLAHMSNTGGALAAIALITRMFSGGGL